MTNLDKNLTSMCEGFSKRNECEVIYRHEMGQGYEIEVTKDGISATVTIDQSIIGYCNIMFLGS